MLSLLPEKWLERNEPNRIPMMTQSAIIRGMNLFDLFWFILNDFETLLFFKIVDVEVDDLYSGPPQKVKAIGEAVLLAVDHSFDASLDDEL